jgi:hypothetical protein
MHLRQPNNYNITHKILKGYTATYFTQSEINGGLYITTHTHRPDLNILKVAIFVILGANMQKSRAQVTCMFTVIT